MDWEKLAKKLAAPGNMVDVEEAAGRLGVSRQTAINYIYEMRKRGFIDTERGRKGIRFYRISLMGIKESGYPGLYEMLNKNSPIKLVEPFRHRLHDHELTPEEAIVRAVLTKDFRAILASLALFRKVSDWSSLYMFAKKHGIQRFVGALYDVSRLCLRVRRMDKRIRNMMKISNIKTKYIIPSARSTDFPDIEKEWGVFIPFSKGDIKIYRR